MSCHARFGVMQLRRKHHCRRCGQVRSGSRVGSLPNTVFISPSSLVRCRMPLAFQRIHIQSYHLKATRQGMTPIINTTTHTHIYIYTHTHLSLSLYIYIYICIHTYIRIHICVCVCLQTQSIHAHVHTWHICSWRCDDRWYWHMPSLCNSVCLSTDPLPLRNSIY